MPEIPRDNLSNKTAPPWALQPAGCFSKPPLNSEPSNHLQISSTGRGKPHPCVTPKGVWWGAQHSSTPATPSYFASAAGATITAAVGSYAFLSWGRRSHGHDHCISFCLCWVLLMPMGLSTSWAPLSSIITQHIITSPPQLRLEPERTLTSQRQLGEPPFPITSTIQSDGIFCKKLKPSVPDDKLVFIRKYKSCVVRLFCTVQFTKLVLVAAAIDRCPVKQDLYCIKMFMILRQQKKKYFHG